jgi:threonine dehydrogenase-like Zn-dependent dehydrogenase
MEKGLTVKTGQTHVQRYTKKLLDLIQKGELDTTFMISHREPLGNAAELYQKWHDEQDTYTKIILKPGMDQKPEVDLVAARAMEPAE